MPTIQNKLNSFAFSLICFAIVSCDLEIPEQSYNDALDLDHNADKGIFPPAFVFSLSWDCEKLTTLDLFNFGVFP